MKSHFKLLLVLFILITSCDPDEFIGVNGTLTIEVAENAIDSENYEGFFLVQGINGEILSTGEIVNGRNYNIEINDYNEQYVNISLIRIADFTDFSATNINTFLEVGINEKIEVAGLGNDIPSTDVRTEITFENLSESMNSVRLSRAGFVTPIGPVGITELNGVPFSYNFSEENSEVFITSHFLENTFTYSKLDLIPNTSIVIDPNVGGINMVENQITVGNQGLDFTSKLVGVNEDMEKLNKFSMYDGLVLDNSTGVLNIPVPLSNTFDMLEVSLRMVIDNIAYDQRTLDTSIPDSFMRLNADLTVNNTDFENTDFTVTGEHNFTVSFWQNSSKTLRWNIYAPNGQTRGPQLESLPDSLVMEGFKEAVDQLELSYILAGQIDNSTYSELLNENSFVKLNTFFSPDDATSKILLKTITY